MLTALATAFRPIGWKGYIPPSSCFKHWKSARHHPPTISSKRLDACKQGDSPMVHLSYGKYNGDQLFTVKLTARHLLLLDSIPIILRHYTWCANSAGPIVEQRAFACPDCPRCTLGKSLCYCIIKIPDFSLLNLCHFRESSSALSHCIFFNSIIIYYRSNHLSRLHCPTLPS